MQYTLFLSKTRHHIFCLGDIFLLTDWLIELINSIRILKSHMPWKMKMRCPLLNAIKHINSTVIEITEFVEISLNIFYFINYFLLYL